MSVRTLTLADTTIGKKAIMAVSGLVLLGFVLVHMAGNLLVFQGPAALNGYADGLRKLGPMLWIARGVLLAAVAAHVWAAVSLYKANEQARPVKYHVQHTAATTYAAKTMRYGGVIILLFVLYHLAHLTFGVGIPGGHAAAPPAGMPGSVSGTDVFHNVVVSFQNPAITGIYVLAQLALALHLYHGAWSFMQTLGLSHPRYNGLRVKLAAAYATVICVGNLSMPIAVMAGLVKLQG